MGLHQVKKFYSAKETRNKERISKNVYHMCDKELIAKIDKKLKKLNNKTS